MRPKRRSSEVSFYSSLKPNLDLLLNSYIIFDGEDEFTNSLDLMFSLKLVRYQAQ